MTQIDALSDQSVVLIYPIVPALDPEEAGHLESMLQKLLVQFQREGAVGPAAAACQHNASMLVIAWEPAGTEPLSGCRHSKISQLLLQFEQQQQVSILNAPPMLVQVDDSWQAHSRSSLKPLVTAQQVGLHNKACNTRCTSLGQWRREGIASIADMWMRPIVERLQTSA